MKNNFNRALGLMLVFAALSCAAKTMLPPRVNLSELEMLGVFEFHCSSRGALGRLTTDRFIEAARHDQGLVRMLALGPEQDALAETGRSRLDRAALKELGEKHGIRTVVTGELIVSDIKPDIDVSPELSRVGLSAEVDAELTVRITETATGASLWSGSSKASRRIGGVSFLGRSVFTFDADDPERAYGELVDVLVDDVTRDFRPTWVRR
jgi:hypothetical protein